jgi:hypothetical protein
MAFWRRRASGHRAWWIDVAVSIAAVGTAQAIVLGGDELLQLVGFTGPDVAAFESALVLERVPGTGTPDVEPPAVSVDGTVSGLYPGAEVDLAVHIRNLSQLAVRLHQLTITVGTPDREGCPVDAILVGDFATPFVGAIELDVLVAPDGTATVLVPISMTADAPSECQGATFPLAYLTAGILP